MLNGIHPPLEVSHAHYIVEMVISCKTKVLYVSDNNLCSSEWIIQMLSHKSCVIEELDVCHNYNTSTEVCELLSYINNNKSLRLKLLDICRNLFDDTIANKAAAFVMLEKVSLSGKNYVNASFILTLFCNSNKIILQHHQ